MPTYRDAWAHVLTHQSGCLCAHSSMILSSHGEFYQEIFNIPGFFGTPVLCFGYQDVELEVLIDGARHDSLHNALASAGVEVHSLDLFDDRADLRYDMNLPVPVHEHDRYATLIDIGSIEHVFDTRQCLENCIRMLKVGGHYLIHTPVSGYFAHGFHTFHPEALLSALEMNGFRIAYLRYSDINGKPVSDPCKPSETVIWQDPEVRDDILIWIVAVKERVVTPFVCPQQGKWKRVYIGAA